MSSKKSFHVLMSEMEVFWNLGTRIDITDTKSIDDHCLWMQQWVEKSGWVIDDFIRVMMFGEVDKSIS